ncbi:ectonucleoside triphosphate diphosphohydrolase 5 isoform X3 [Ornithorhynchus anatinus]|uniref:ectonucleoside triphosphate diphosphohydrolase 5 isoform X3 n=1 Tax=Ornithorhynchus anatinus TaxID=9258 RepID=UPI0019D47D5E|nr:ectonucleoside triphosphate diphosphohydrolase 5 isoform X3 [Ornithorhynchus anatinus]
MTPGPPAALALLAACLLCCAARRREPPTWFEGVFPSSACPVAAATLYGVMFDAGSTGTRIHVYTFVRRRPEQPPELEGEIFDSVKPGLSAFADRPKQGAETVRELLEVAKESVPAGSWKRTPVVLKATAGLRLLPDHKARALLSEVREVLEKSPFLVPEDGVSIMDGSYEGILAWVTVNFLTGNSGPDPQRSPHVLRDVQQHLRAVHPQLPGIWTEGRPAGDPGSPGRGRGVRPDLPELLPPAAAGGRVALRGRQVPVRRQPGRGDGLRGLLRRGGAGGPREAAPAGRDPPRRRLLRLLLLLRPRRGRAPHRRGQGRNAPSAGLRKESSRSVRALGTPAVRQPLPLHGPELHRRPAEGGLRLRRHDGPAVNQEGERRRDGLGVGRHLPPAAVSGSLPLSPGGTRDRPRATRPATDRAPPFNVRY